MSTTYTFVQIPTSLGVSCEHQAESLEQAQAWALMNLDTSTRWVIKLDGRNIAEAINVYLWRCHGTNGEATKQKFNSLGNRAGWFLTKIEAEADYEKYRNAAMERLDSVGEELSQLMSKFNCELNYEMLGDTHGIYEDYQYISVQESGYEYRLAV
jgi:hypothetical protein